MPSSPSRLKKGDARRAPALVQVEDWVKQAKALGRGIEY